MGRLRWQHPFYPKKRRQTRYKTNTNKREISNRPKQQKKKPSVLTYLGMVVFFLILFTTLTAMFAQWMLGPTIRSWGELRAINLATRAINVAVEETMAASISSTDMALLIRDNQERLQGVQYDMGEINRVSSQATRMIQQTLNNLAEEVFPLPLGQLTGLDFLAAWGPGIPVRIVPTGAVTTTPMASFESAGINQTWHRVYLDIEVVMRVIVPLIDMDLPVNSQVPIVEEIFIGDVPTWYFATEGSGVAPIEENPESGVIEFKLVE